MSRPRIDPKAAKAAKPTPAASPTPTAAAKSGPGAPAPNAAATPSVDPGVDPALSQQAATISREASGIAGGEAQTGARYEEGQGQTVESIGPDGVKRRVRIIDPTL
jgi:hypothetical protein